MIPRTLLAFFLVVSLTACLAVPANRLMAANMIAGPLVGHTTPTSTRIWVETDAPAEVTVEYWIEPRVHYDDTFRQAIVRGSAKVRTQEAVPFTATVDLTGLRPGWLLHYTIAIDGAGTLARSPQVVSLMPPLFPYTKEPATPAQFSVAFASCTYPGLIPVQPVWAQILRHRPSAVLFLGDNNYLPNTPVAYETDRESIRFMIAGSHRELRNLPGLRDLVASTPTYAIWDDHDYGPGNSDRNFSWKADSLDLFQRFWPNRSAGTKETLGIFSSFRIADAEFFLLDNRYHRDPNESPDSTTMFGTEQMAWLKEALLGSDATFKVIVSGGSLLSDASTENWGNYGDEREQFLAWMFARKIDGVLFIGGDWHVGAMNKMHREQDPYPLYELISSNAAVDYERFDPPPSHISDNRHNAAGTVVNDYNYGSLYFSGPSDDRTVTLRIIDLQGNFPIEHIIHATELTSVM